MHFIHLLQITKKILLVIHLILQILTAIVGLTITLRTLGDVRARQLLFDCLQLISERTLEVSRSRRNNDPQQP
jgi:hypothetical protein